MGGQGVASQHGVDIAVVYQLLKGVPGVVVKGKRRPHDPDDLAMVPVVAQEIINFIVILGECRLPGPVLPEGEHVLLGGALLEAVGVDVNAILAVFRPACEDQVASLQNPNSRT